MPITCERAGRTSSSWASQIAALVALPGLRTFVAILIALGFMSAVVAAAPPPDRPAVEERLAERVSGDRARGDGGSRGAATTRSDLWYELRLGGVHCGWMRSVVDERDGRIRTSTETQMRLERAGERVTIELDTEFDETPRGAPLRLLSRSKTGAIPVTTIWTFPSPGDAGAQVDAVEINGSRERRTTEPMPAGTWLPPAAAERFFAERRAVGAVEVSYVTIDGQSGLRPTRVTARRVGTGTFALEQDRRGARKVPTTIWELTSDLIPVATTIELSSDGPILRSSAMLGSERLETILSTRDRARKIGAAPAPDLVAATMVAPDRPIERPLAATTARLRLTLHNAAGADGAAPAESVLPDLPSAGAQRFEREGPGSAVLVIDLDDALPATDAERADEAYRATSALIDFDDPAVTALVNLALGRKRAPTLQTAERLRDFVARHIRNKDLATAFAGAAETARSRAGDCTEHAVLLAAMLRAVDIPARIAVGLVYADRFAGRRDVFAWHMWTQALLQDDAGDDAGVWRWVDLDATLAGRRHHAAHILTATTSLAEGPVDPRIAGILPLLGRLRIEVVEVGYAVSTSGKSGTGPNFGGP